jgi:hypothetical protein
MTALLERALAAASALPDDVQDEAARAVLSYFGQELPSFDRTAEDQQAVARSREACAMGEFASDEQIRAIWAKHGL